MTTQQKNVPQPNTGDCHRASHENRNLAEQWAARAAAEYDHGESDTLMIAAAQIAQAYAAIAAAQRLSA